MEHTVGHFYLLSVVQTNEQTIAITTKLFQLQYKGPGVTLFSATGSLSELNL